MINHMLPRMAQSCVILTIALAHCGCQSTGGMSGWTSAWKSKPRQSSPSDKEVVTYWGQKKSKPKQPDMGELKERLAEASSNREGSSQATFENHLKQGNQALRANRLPEAQAAFEKALAIRPDDPDCHHRLAVVADKNQQFGAADDHYEAALKSRPRDPNLLSDLGYSYSLRREDRRAEVTLEQALAISPSHKGAMANLGAIYAKQGRYEDATAMFRRGASESEVQQYLAQLFPQRSGMPGIDTQALAQNSNPNSSQSPPATADARPDFRNMTPEQLKEAMNRERNDSKRRREEQLRDEIKPPRRDWYDGGQQTAQAPQSSNSPPIQLGPGSNEPPANSMPSNQFPVVTPNGGYPANSGNPTGFANNGSGFPPNGSGNPPSDSLRAQPGTTPDIAAWNGAGGMRDENLQGAGGQPQYPPHRSGVTNVPYYPEQSTLGNPSANPAGQFGQQAPLNGLNLQNSPGNGGGNSISAGTSINQAAAQIGMNFGPGGLFPVVPADAVGQAGFSPQGQASPTIETRFGTEFPSPPSYQNPGLYQSQPSRTGLAPGDQRQGAASGSSWGNDRFQSPASESLSNFNGNQQLGPPSPASGWPQPNSQVIQAGAGSPDPRFQDPMGSPSGSPNSTWADKPDLGSAPFNGAWPPGSSTGDRGAVNPAQGSTNAPNSIPMWNSGQANSRPQPAQFGPATSSSGNYPEQWPGAPR